MWLSMLINLLTSSSFIFIVLAVVFVKLLMECSRGRCISATCLVGKTAIVTGGNTGIGFQTVLALAARGCRVIIADKDDATESRKKIIAATGNANILAKHLDLASFASIRKFADDIKESEQRLDLLINNAGTGGLGRTQTVDGLNMVMQVNHYGPFLLTHLLIDLLKKSKPSRIIFLASIMAFINCLSVDFMRNSDRNKHVLYELIVYGNTKACSIITGNMFGEKLRGTGVTANSVNPGFSNTAILSRLEHILKSIVMKLWRRTIIRHFAKSPEEGAQTTLHAAISQDLENVSGVYFSDCAPAWQPRITKDKEFCTAMWEISEQTVGLSPEEQLLYTM